MAALQPFCSATGFLVISKAGRSCWLESLPANSLLPCDTISPTMTQDSSVSAIANSPATPSPGQYLAPEALLRLLSRLSPNGSAAPTDATASLYLTADTLVQWADTRDPSLREWRRFLSPALEGPGGDALLKADTGLVALRNGERGLAILPPFPVKESSAPETWEEAPLRELLSTDYTVGVVLLRLGRYLVAVFRGTEPLVTKTDTRYVKGKHHAGGTSQLRFKRIREGQMRKLFDEACGVVSSRFEPHDRDLDYILLGGEKLTLNGFLKVCPYLQRRRNLILDRRLNIRDPRRDTLETVSGMLRQSRVWAIVP